MKKGVVLLVSLVVMSVLIIIGSGFLSYVVNERVSSTGHMNSVKAFYIAEAGLDWSVAELRQGNSGSISNEPFGDGSYNVNVYPLGGALYRIESTGMLEDSDITETLSLFVKDQPFNVYSYFTDVESYTRTYCTWWGWCWTVQEPVWFISGDRLEGPVFTNSEYHISGDPEFYGQVQSVANEIVYKSGPPIDNPYFDPSYNPNPNFGVDPIALPNFSGDDNLEDLQNQGENFTGDTYIEFKDDGTMDVTNASRGWSDHNTSIPSSKGIYVGGGNAYISGVLNGEVTVAAGQGGSGSGGNVVFKDNTRYSQRYDAGGSLKPLHTDIDGDGEDEFTGIDSDATDYLGVIAEKNVIIDKDAPYDLEINGSIMALGDSFVVERWYDSNYNKGTLTVLGGIIQRERGPVGTFSGSNKISGYSKNYIYDGHDANGEYEGNLKRLNDHTLPYFPTTGEYVVKSWREE
jgi:hypothetical protein